MPSDVATIDVGTYFESQAPSDLEAAGLALREASEQVGFYILVGHGLPKGLTNECLGLARRFFGLATSEKERIRMDRPEWPLRGVGYLPVGARKLPTRTRGNRNEAFLIKSGGGIRSEDNQWPDDAKIPGMRQAIERYGSSLTSLARSLLPIYATALELDPGFFSEAFTDPFYRLRMTHYPPLGADTEDFSIAPHVDSTFFTILAQDSVGLTIFSEAQDAWLEVPHIEGSLIVNTGELLKHWSNDRFVSVKHFVRNSRAAPRYSIPFFFNANADYVMQCLPSCHGPDNPPRHPPISYLQSQAVAQGE